MNCLNCGAKVNRSRRPIQQMPMQPIGARTRSRSNTDPSFQRMLNLGTQSLERELSSERRKQGTMSRELGDLEESIDNKYMGKIMGENLHMVQSAEDLMRDIDRKRLSYQRPISPSDIAIMPSPLMVPRPPSGLPPSQRAAREARTARKARLERTRRSNRPTAVSKNLSKLTPEKKRKMMDKKRTMMYNKQIQDNLKIIRNLVKLPMSDSEKEKLIKKYKEQNQELILKIEKINKMKGGKKRTKKSKKTKKLRTKKMKKSKMKKMKRSKAKKSRTKNKN